MKEKPLTDLTDEALLKEQKKMKTSTTVSAFFIGLLIGISIYSTITNGLGFFTFFPLFFVLIVISNAKKLKEVKQEIAARNLK